MFRNERAYLFVISIFLPSGMQHLPPWRNRLARSAVNRKVGGSSPPGGATFLLVHPVL